MRHIVKSVGVYFDSDQRLIGVPEGECQYGSVGLDIYLVLEPGYDDTALENFLLNTLDMCYTKKGTIGGPTALEKYTGKKNYNVAVKGFRELSFVWRKDEGYSFIPVMVNKEYKGSFTPLWDEKITVPLAYEKGVLAQAFRKAMEISIQADLPTTNYQPKKTFTLLCEKEVLYLEPEDGHFINVEDYGAAEIYQGYSYCDDGNDCIAEFFFSIASELDCDLSPDNIRKKWEQFHGKTDTFEVSKTDVSVFTLRAEFRNKEVHKISYFKQVDEYELFACELQIKLAKVSKPLHSKLIKLFEEFAENVSLS